MAYAPPHREPLDAHDRREESDHDPRGLRHVGVVTTHEHRHEQQRQDAVGHGQPELISVEALVEQPVGGGRGQPQQHHGLKDGEQTPCPVALFHWLHSLLHERTLKEAPLSTTPRRFIPASSRSSVVARATLLGVREACTTRRTPSKLFERLEDLKTLPATGASRITASRPSSRPRTTSTNRRVSSRAGSEGTGPVGTTRSPCTTSCP